ncbi:MAG: hypothetical protein IJU95_01400, partial [Treponema sp.]|nr:hypothetical protein [Treponema sp.]
MVEGIIKLHRRGISLFALLFFFLAACPVFSDDVQDGAVVTSRDSIFSKRQKTEEQSAAAAQKSEPAEAAKATEPARKSEAAQKSEPVKASEAAKTAEATKTAEAAKTTEPAKTAEAAKTTEATKPAKATEPAKSAELVQVTAPVQAAEPAQASEPVKTGGDEAFPSRKKTPGVTEIITASSDTETVTQAVAVETEGGNDFSPNETDPYTGWKYSVVDTAEYRKGHLKAVLKGWQGSFGLYAVRDDGKEIPLLSSYDFFNSTAFMLRVGRKEYLLNYSGGVKSEARRTEVGLQMAYTIPGKAFFLVDFTFPEKRVTGGLEDTIKLTMYTVNLGKNPQTFTSKAVFDTILGESSSRHFCTFVESELNGQRKFHSMKSDRWVCSANNAAAIEFLLYGADVSEPDCVTLGPIGNLYDYWEPVAHDGKGFSTVLSYNNSGVAVNWKTAYLLPEQTDVKTF